MDANQSEVVETLRLIPGCSVLSLAPMGRGVPDLLVGYRGFNFLVELKNGKDRSRPETAEAQQKFADEWQGQVMRATSSLEIINYMTGA